MSSGQLPTTLAALAVVVGLIWLAARLARTTGLGRGRQPTRDARLFSLEDTLQLDRQRRLHVVRCDGQGFVVLTGGPSDVVVHLPAPVTAEGVR